MEKEKVAIAVCLYFFSVIYELIHGMSRYSTQQEKHSPNDPATAKSHQHPPPTRETTSVAQKRVGSRTTRCPSSPDVKKPQVHLGKPSKSNTLPDRHLNINMDSMTEDLFSPQRHRRQSSSKLFSPKFISGLSGGAGRVKTPSKKLTRTASTTTLAIKAAACRPVHHRCNNNHEEEDDHSIDENPVRLLEKPRVPSAARRVLVTALEKEEEEEEQQELLNQDNPSQQRMLWNQDNLEKENHLNIPDRPWQVSDFRIGKKLGRGKYGNVYFARERTSGRPVALKVLFKSSLDGQEALLNLRREVEIQSRVHHTHILECYGYFYDSAHVYLLLEYAPEGEVFRTLKSVGYFQEQVARAYVRQVCEALAYCHARHVIHRDVKPENLLFVEAPPPMMRMKVDCSTPSGQQHTSRDVILKLADFGASVHAPPPYHRRTTMCGTRDYLSPEMWSGDSHSTKVDCWSVGVLAFEFLFGRTPFESDQDALVPGEGGRAGVSELDMCERIRRVDYAYVVYWML